MPGTTRRSRFGAAAAGLLASPALAFPDRTLRIISGYVPGGLNDIVSRAMAQAMTPIPGHDAPARGQSGWSGLTHAVHG